MAIPNFHKQVNEHDAALIRELLEHWKQSVPALEAVISRLQTQMEAAIRRGETVDRIWLISRLERLPAFERDMLAALAAFVRVAERVTGRSIEAAVRLATNQIASKVLGANPLPLSATSVIIANTAPGTALDALFARIGPSVVSELRKALITGVSSGWAPSQTAKRLRDIALTSRSQAATIARTETMRAYRESSSTTYEFNRELLDGWTWSADLGPGTCALCWAMDGTVHEVTERMNSHPNCRCVMIPLLRGAPRPKTGEEKFAALSAVNQRRILSPGEFRLYKQGLLKLSDLVEFRPSPYGPTLSRIPLSRLQKPSVGFFV